MTRWSDSHRWDQYLAPALQAHLQNQMAATIVVLVNIVIWIYKYNKAIEIKHIKILAYCIVL